jgi:hypothetical protein
VQNLRLTSSNGVSWDRAAAGPFRGSSHDPTFRLIGSEEILERGAALTSHLQTFETEMLAEQENFAGPARINRELIGNREGDCLAAKLRSGNVHSADDWEELLLPDIERQQKLGKEVVFRADAAFAKPEIYEAWRRAA